MIALHALLLHGVTQNALTAVAERIFQPLPPLSRAAPTYYSIFRFIILYAHRKLHAFV